jgi:hypothetical protein
MDLGLGFGSMLFGIGFLLFVLCLQVWRLWVESSLRMIYDEELDNMQLF